MKPENSQVLASIFRFLIAKRFWIVGFYALLVIPAIYFSLKVTQNNSPERLVVQNDQDFRNTQEFNQVFGKQEPVILFFDTPYPFTAVALKQIAEIQSQVEKIPDLQATSILSLYRNLQGSDFDGTSASTQKLLHFALGTDLFVKQGLLDPARGSLSIQILLTTDTEELRQKTLHSVDQIVDQFHFPATDITNVRKVGQPYISDYLDQQTRKAGIRSFLLFGIFVIVLNGLLYRSLRALIAFILTLGVSTALTVGFIGITGGVFTIVSSLIPMTILITCTATLVYIHSRFVDHPKDTSVDDHQIFSLTNKFLACTASIFATATGFAALVVSKIRPIREMGLWVAIGLVFTWIVIFTLFPALQKILKTPTEQKQKIAGQWFLKMMERLPKFSYRFRFLLIGFTLLWCICGIIALFGFPHLISPMKLQTNALEYINPQSKLYQDTKQLETQMGGGIFLTEIWLSKTSEASSSVNFRGLPLVLALNNFARQLEQNPDTNVRVIDYPSMLRMLIYFQSYVQSQSSFSTFPQTHTPSATDQLIQDPIAWKRFVDSLPTLFALSPSLQGAIARFTALPDFEQTRLSVFTRSMSYEEFTNLTSWIKSEFANQQKLHPELQTLELKIVGSGLLQAKTSHYLVPTLTESFGLTVLIIFGVFLLVFRSGPARIMAMIPSLFAILAMFAIMRIFGMNLNIATILIASTVLGTSENDQIHFFYHYQEEKRIGGTTEQALKHTLFIAGRAIFFATLINAGGFLAFALADLPPIHQFGILSSLAFILSMIADFTALPAALWVVFRDKPDASKQQNGISSDREEND